VQPSRDLVAVVVELASGMENGENDFGGGLAAGVPVDGYAAAVVDNGDRVVDMNRDVDRWCRPGAPVDPMYMAGRVRTASSPSRTLILSAL
jgi:hypothetical protein